MKAAREAIGEHIPLMLDANNAWSDLRTAELHCKAYESYNPEWISTIYTMNNQENESRDTKNRSNSMCNSVQFFFENMQGSRGCHIIHLYVPCS